MFLFARYDACVAAFNEQIAGEQFRTPSPPIRHTYAKTALLAQLIHSYSRSWCFLSDPELHLGDDIVVSDLAGWKRDTMPPPDSLAIELPPLWICEVVSLITQGLDRIRKLPLYAQHGVGYAWMLDPAARGVEVFRLHGRHWSLLDVYEGATLIRAEPFDACDIDLGALWIEP